MSGRRQLAMWFLLSCLPGLGDHPAQAVVLITIDTLRADHLAADGVWFRAVQSNFPRTSWKSSGPLGT